MDSALRLLVRTRAGNRCEYCRIHQDQDPFFTFPVDHIIARQHRGLTAPIIFVSVASDAICTKDPISRVSTRRPETSLDFFIRDEMIGPSTSSGTGRFLSDSPPSAAPQSLFSRSTTPTMPYCGNT